MTLRYLLGTNVVSELRKPRPHRGVVAWRDAPAGPARGPGSLQYLPTADDGPTPPAGGDLAPEKWSS